jgi:radical SAM superfamily enzyme YgiQ (UPF0313 family)
MKEQIDTARLRTIAFKVGPFRPPSEGASSSLLLLLTENCPWNKCTFCSLYKNGKFAFRTVDDIKKDIDRVSAMAEQLRNISRHLGHAGRINRKVLTAIDASDPSVCMNHCFTMVARWLLSGAKTAFLQDSNSLVMRPAELIEVLRHLKKTFDSVQRVTTYARSHTIYHKKTEDLANIRRAGLDRLHVGLETGDDELLKKIKKGVTSDQQIQAGIKAKNAGFELSEYFMTDLGGRDFFRQHAENTARVLTKINPDYIRSRPLVPIPGTELYDEFRSGNFKLSSPHQRLEELKLMVQGLDFNGRIVFDHFNNSWRNAHGGPLLSGDHEGYKFPEEKQKVLNLIEQGLQIDESIHISVQDLMRHITL